MLGQCRRRWIDIKPALGWCLQLCGLNLKGQWRRYCLWDLQRRYHNLIVHCSFKKYRIWINTARYTITSAWSHVIWINSFLTNSISNLISRTQYTLTQQPKVGPTSGIYCSAGIVLNFEQCPGLNNNLLPSLRFPISSRFTLLLGLQ